jgi:hypothetical protein
MKILVEGTGVTEHPIHGGNVGDIPARNVVIEASIIDQLIHGSDL